MNLNKKFATNIFLIICVAAIIVIVVTVFLFQSNYKQRSTQNTPQITEFQPAKYGISSSVISSFLDSKGNKKYLISDLKGPDNNTGEYIHNILLSDNPSNQSGVIKLLNIGSSELGKSPFISENTGTKYIIMELIGPGDGQEIAIFDESGRSITLNLYKDSHQTLGLGSKIKGQYYLSFRQWQDKTTIFYVDITSGEDSKYTATFNASTGKLVGEVQKIQ